MRFAAIFVPDFAVQAAMRFHPGNTENRNQPVAILDGPDSLLQVFACNPAAQVAGVEIGMTRVQAEQCPGLVLQKRVTAQENAAQSALIECALVFSPLVESTAAGAVTFEIAGTHRVFGPPPKLAQQIVQNAARVGFEVNVALAANPDAALIAAKGRTGISIVASREERRKCLSALPVHVLSPTTEQAEIFDAWGIRTCGDLAALPTVPLVERLGQEGLHLHTLARGQAQRSLIAVDPPRNIEELIELEDSVTDLESLAFLLNRLLNQISARLCVRGVVTEEIRLRLDLEIHRDRELHEELQPTRSAAFERRLKFPVPIGDTKALLKLLQLDLAAHNPGAPVKSVAIEAMPAKPRYTQTGLFTPRAPESERLEVTLARLRAVVGEADEQGRNRVGAPQVCDSHKPDDFQVVPFTTEATKASESSFLQKSEVALNVFRPPLPARVRRRGKPVHIAFAELSAPIICAAGPWFTSGLWWQDSERWSREEWDIAIRLEPGLGFYRIFKEAHRWFVEGLYD
jgi:protein ImuB